MRSYDYYDFLEAHGIEMLECDADKLDHQTCDAIRAWFDRSIVRGTDPEYIAAGLNGCFTDIIVRDFLSRYTDDEFDKLCMMFTLKTNRADGFTLGLARGMDPLTFRDLIAYRLEWTEGRQEHLIDRILAGFDIDG